MSFDKSKLKSSVKNIKISAPSTIFGETGEEVQSLLLKDLKEFPQHPFKVLEDENFNRLKESISEFGVMSPILVRPKKFGTYEIIAGHRRSMAARLLNLDEIPAVVRDLDDEEAILFMVDTNIQREELLPSEKAFAYKMKMDALKKQGKRNDLISNSSVQKFEEEAKTTSDLMGQKLEEEETTSDLMGQKSEEEAKTTLDLMGQKYHFGPNGSEVREEAKPTSDLMGQKLTTREKLAKNSNDSSMQIQRYIRLTELCPKFLQWTDEKFIPFQGAVELSYLTLEEQALVVFAMESLNCSVTLAQSKKLREKGNLVNLTDEVIEEIFQEPFFKEKKTTLKLDTKKYFPENTSKKEMEEVIEGLLKEWKRENAKRVT